MKSYSYPHDRLNVEYVATLELPTMTMEEFVRRQEAQAQCGRRPRRMAAASPVEREVIIDGYICEVVFEGAPYDADWRRIRKVIAKLND